MRRAPGAGQDRDVIGGQRLRTRCSRLLTEIPDAVLVEIHELTGGGVECSRMPLEAGAGRGESAAAVHQRTQWLLDSLGGRRVRAGMEVVGRIAQLQTRGVWGRRWFVLAPESVTLALAEVSHQQRLTVARVQEIAWYGEEWASACAGLRDTSASPWRAQSVELTAEWEALSERAREVVVGLADTWEGSARELCAVAREL